MVSGHASVDYREQLLQYVVERKLDQHHAASRCGHTKAYYYIV